MEQDFGSLDFKARPKSLLYLLAGMEVPASVQQAEQKCGVRVTHLPAEIRAPGEVNMKEITPSALLYPPNPYVVPDDCFNELYGWNSHFIIRGLLRDHRLDWARGMVENFFFEIEHYEGRRRH